MPTQRARRYFVAIGANPARYSATSERFATGFARDGDAKDARCAVLNAEQWRIRLTCLIRPRVAQTHQATPRFVTKRAIPRSVPAGPCHCEEKRNFRHEYALRAREEGGGVPQ